MAANSPAFLEPSAEQEFMVEFDHSATIGNERATMTYDYPCYADGGYGTIRGHFKVSLWATNNTDVDVATLDNNTVWIYPVDFRLGGTAYSSKYQVAGW